MSNEYLVIPFVGKGSVGATAVQVSDGFGTNLPMRISKDNVDFDGITVGGEEVLGLAPTASDVSVDLTATNYTAATPDVEAHLTGINNALGSLPTFTATEAEVNYNNTSAETETLITGGVISVTKSKTKLEVVGGGTVTLAAPSAEMFGRIKLIEVTVYDGTVTMALDNVRGQAPMANAVFDGTGYHLVLMAGTTYWYILSENNPILIS